MNISESSSLENPMTEAREVRGPRATEQRGPRDIIDIDEQTDAQIERLVQQHGHNHIGREFGVTR